MPENLFSLLNEAQRNILKEVKFLTFQEVDILKIHPKAFEEELVKEIDDLRLVSNKLIELPDAVFEPFLKMENLEFGDQLFVTLDNNLFGNEPSTLKFLTLNNMNLLTLFPDLVRNTPNLEAFTFLGSSSVENANSTAFESLNSLQFFIISSSAPIIVELGVAQLAADLGIDESIIVLR